ncbi:MAG TPA: c-type cytochrome [Candidatus Sulfotelmatobacter sp.]|nr:c-type cytochrome [Candidatus Sulfotelmatobacter sp.]
MNLRKLQVIAFTLASGAFLLALAARSQAPSTNSQPLSEPPPYWAYAVNPPAPPPDAPAKPEDTAPLHVPGSKLTFTSAQIHDLFHAVDWHPSAHPTMPAVVAHGRANEMYACAYCHLPNGLGRPENSSLAGLPAAYIIQQLADFKSGARKSSDPDFKPAFNMVSVGAKATDPEVQAAAEYFSAMKPRPWIRVVESKFVPKTHVAGWMLVVSTPHETESIGDRIIETPENLERTELRDDTSGFIAYVPPGSLKRGKTLVTTGANGKTIICSTCHGPNLRGLKNVPALAGRSPSYIVRQLYDMQTGARAGVNIPQMKPVVANLSLFDLIDVAAYTSSLEP